MAKPIDVVRKMLEMVDAGRMKGEVFDNSLSGLLITTNVGEGSYKGGMLKLLDGKVVTLNVSNISAVRHAPPEKGRVLEGRAGSSLGMVGEGGC